MYMQANTGEFSKPCVIFHVRRILPLKYASFIMQRSSPADGFVVAAILDLLHFVRCLLSFSVVETEKKISGSNFFDV